jgi:glycine/D-amino acid oxidase-like deaminating enzyme
MSLSFDVVVIGGGIMGCCSGFELAKKGLKVAVIEKATIGEGPTGKSSAIIRQHYSNELTARMALYSLNIFHNFKELIGDESGFTQSGFVVVVGDKDKAGLEANIKFQQSMGIKTGLLSTSEAQELMPGLLIGNQAVLAYEPGSGYADPYLTVNAYAQAAKRHGVTFFLETAVTGIHFRSGKVIGLDTNRERFDTSTVINCAGAWGGQVSRMAKVNVPINSCRVQVAFFRRPPGEEGSHPVVADFVNAIYFRSETGGLTLVGLIDPSEADAIVDPDNYREYMEDGFLLDAGSRLVNRYPAMEKSRTANGYASLYAITPDWHPIIDEVPRDSGFYICSGFSGHGFKLGPAVGLMVADLVVDNEDPVFDPTLFSFSRFGEENMVSGQYEYSIVG